MYTQHASESLYSCRHVQKSSRILCPSYLARTSPHCRAQSIERIGRKAWATKKVMAETCLLCICHIFKNACIGR